MGTALSVFERSLAELDVGCTRITPAGFPDVIRDLIREPAVGVRLPFDSVSLDEAPVVLDPTPSQLERARTGITNASIGIASYGSIVVPTTSEGTEAVSLFCDHHIAVLRASDVLMDMAEAMEWMGSNVADARSSAVVATGPSATADMGALVYGAHGPRTVEVLILEGDNRGR